MPAPWSSWQEEAAADFCTGKAERLEVARSRVISGLALLRAAMHEAQAEMAVGSTGRASGFNQADEVDGKKETLTVPRRCLNPPCVHLCPWGGGGQDNTKTGSRASIMTCVRADQNAASSVTGMFSSGRPWAVPAQAKSNAPAAGPPRPGRPGVT
ncbi:MAG: hypothetical protein K9K62_06930 [Desulfobacteraceae bacterium]|nr:hypothetical protein [Desulfobacteraceae bacterium]